MRTGKSIRNIFVSLFVSTVTIIAGFVAQKIFLDELGLGYLGLNGLLTNIVSMLAIVELGIGSAIIYHLYKPLSKNQHSKVKALLNFYKRIYRIIALIVLGIGLVIAPFIPLLANGSGVDENLYVLFGLFLADVVLSYLLSYKRSILFADQKNYLIDLVHVGYIVLINSLQITALLVTHNYYLYLIIKIICRVIENIVISIIVDKKYALLKAGKSQKLAMNIKKDIFKKMKGLFMHKIGAFIVLGSDNIIIAAFLGIKTVGLYSNYLLVLTAVNAVVSQLFTSMTSSVGNMLIVNNQVKSYDIYRKLRFANYWLASVVSIGFFVAIDPFITLWLGGEYVLGTGVVLALTINLYLQIMRAAINSFKEAAGIFHEDRFVPIIESVVNIVFSIIFLHFFGLAGVFMGTILSNLVLHLYSYPHFVYKKLFGLKYARYYKEFVVYFVLTSLMAVVTYMITREIKMSNDIVQFIINGFCAVIIPSAILYVLYRGSDEFKYFTQLIAYYGGRFTNRKSKQSLQISHFRNKIVDKNNSTLHKKVLERTRRVLVALTLVTFVWAIIVAFTSQLIPGKYLGIGFVLSTFITIGILYLQAKYAHRLKASVILSAIMVVLVLSNAGIIIAGTVANSFFSSVQDAPQSYEEYSIVSLKSKTIQLNTPNQKIGILSNEPSIDSVKSEAGKKTTATQTSYNNPTSMIVDLQDNKMQMVVLKTSYLKMLQETNNIDVFLQLEVLATFKVKAEQAESAPSIDMTKPFIVYISGIDTYGNISTTSRSDVNILAVVNPVTHKVLLVNTPRDYYVQLHGTTGVKDKLTHAGLYGIDTSVATMEDLYGVDINYNIRINFSSLQKIVDTLGGVEVESEYAFTAEGNTFEVGKNSLNGKQALAFSRERHSFEDGDRTRGQNQQRVIQAIINKMSEPSLIIKYQQVLSDVQDSFQTNMSSSDIATLFRNQLDSMAKWNVASTVVDGTGASDYTYSFGSQKLYVMIPDQASVDAAKTAINTILR